MQKLLIFFAFIIFGNAALAQSQRPIVPQDVGIQSPLGIGNVIAGGPVVSQMGSSLSVGANGGISLSANSIPAYNNCYWSDNDACNVVNVRLRERVFIGEAVQLTNSSPNCCGNVWVGSTPSDVTYLMRDPQVVVTADRGQTAVSGLTRTSDQTGTGRSAIGISGYCWNNAPASGTDPRCWGGYFQADHQPTNTNTASYGVEIDAFNYATNQIGDPYGAGFGAFAMWVTAQGTSPPSAAMTINSGGQAFNTGINFTVQGLTKDSDGNSIALQMGSGAEIAWYSNTATKAGILSSNAAGTIRFGALDTAIPVAQTLQSQSVLAGTTNGAGANTLFKGSAGTGSGVGGNLTFQVAIPSSSGSTQNSYQTALNILGTQSQSIVQVANTGVVTAVNNGNSISKFGVKGTNAGNASTSASIMNFGGANGSSPAALFLAYSRSASLSVQASVAANDNLGVLFFDGSDGTSFRDSAAILTQAEGTIGTGFVPGRIVFQTANASGSLTEALRIDSGQQMQFAAAGLSANGSVATALSSVGPTGSHTTVQEWITVKGTGGAVRYIPAF